MVLARYLENFQALRRESTTEEEEEPPAPRPSGVFPAVRPGRRGW